MIDKFRDEYDWASNFHMRAISIGGCSLKSNEHFFQSCKTINPQEAKFVLDSPTAYIAKQRGKTVTLRPDWKAIRVGAMAIGLWYKFTYNPDLKEKLLLTDDQLLVEGNWWHDNFWGDCRFAYGFSPGPCTRCLGIEGQNKIGELLMQLRGYYQEIDSII